VRNLVTTTLLVWLLVGLAFSAQQDYYLTGNLKEAAGQVIADVGKQRASFFGAIGIRVVPRGREVSLFLTDLNLVSEGVSAKRGKTGPLSLMLAEEVGLSYDPKSGQASAELALILHYELIDRLKGFQQLGSKGEQDLFAPFTEGMKGKLNISFPEGLQLQDKGETKAECEIELELSKTVLGVVRLVSLRVYLELSWTRLFSPAQVLRVQPVFIGTGPSDPNATGRVFSTLIRKAAELWNRCGSVRCITIVSNTPIYLNKPAYKVLESETEAINLLAEVNVANAVEVFVVDRMDFACSWGGGACFSSGTASAKVVTCDQQLSIPAPCPCPGYCPATCPPCPPCQTGAVNYYHLAHELGHALNLAHPPGPSGGLAASTPGSNMEPSGFCCDNPNVQSAKNCRNASNPLLYWGLGICSGAPDIMD